MKGSLKGSIFLSSQPPFQSLMEDLIEFARINEFKGA